jgi:hypothetical protein
MNILMSPRESTLSGEYFFRLNAWYWAHAILEPSGMSKYSEFH